MLSFYDCCHLCLTIAFFWWLSFMSNKCCLFVWQLSYKSNSCCLFYDCHLYLTVVILCLTIVSLSDIWVLSDICLFFQTAVVYAWQYFLTCDIYVVYSKVLRYKAEMQRLKLSARALQEKVNQDKDSILKHQKQRQKEIWKLLSTVTSQVSGPYLFNFFRYCICNCAISVSHWFK